MASWFDSNAPAGTANPNPPYIPPEAGGFTGGVPPGGYGERPGAGSAVPATNGPSTAAPQGGYTEAWFRQLFGSPKTSAELQALAPKLKEYGIEIAPSAAGVIGDIKLPNGQIVDVIQGASSGGTGPTWIPDAPGGGGGGTDPYTGTFTGGGKYPLAAVMGTGWNQPWTTPFQAPNDVTQQNDPGWQFRMKEGTRAIERSAASRGTLLTGGAIKDLNAWAQEFASNEYDKVYNRAKGEYDTAYGIFSNNQNNAFTRPYQIAQLGQSSAGQTANAASQYGTNSAINAAGGANAAAAGVVGANNASTTGVVGAINTGLDYLGTWAGRTRPPATDTGGVTVDGGAGGTPEWTYPGYQYPRGTF